MYQFLGHCDLALDLVSRIIKLGAYLIRIPFGVWIHLGMAEWCIPFWATLNLTLSSDFISWCISPILQITSLECVLC